MTPHKPPTQTRRAKKRGSRPARSTTHPGRNPTDNRDRTGTSSEVALTGENTVHGNAKRNRQKSEYGETRTHQDFRRDRGASWSGRALGPIAAKQLKALSMPRPENDQTRESRPSRWSDLLSPNERDRDSFGETGGGKNPPTSPTTAAVEGVRVTATEIATTSSRIRK